MQNIYVLTYQKILVFSIQNFKKLCLVPGDIDEKPALAQEI